MKKSICSTNNFFIISIKFIQKNCLVRTMLGNHYFYNLKVPTLDIQIKPSLCHLFHTKVSISVPKYLNIEFVRFMLCNQSNFYLLLPSLCLCKATKFRQISCFHLFVCAKQLNSCKSLFSFSMSLQSKLIPAHLFFPSLCHCKAN